MTLCSKGSSASSTGKASDLSQSLVRSGKLIPQNELRRSEGSGMLIGDPLGEGSNASSTHNAQKGAACS